MAQSKSNKILIIIIVLLLFILIGGSGVAIYIYMNNDSLTQLHVSTVQKKTNFADEKLAQIGPLYPLDPFTVNLKTADGKDVYLKTTLTLELDSKLLANELNSKNAVIRDEIIKILSNQKAETISIDIEQDKVCKQIKDKLNSMLSDGQVENVYILSLIVQ